MPVLFVDRHKLPEVNPHLNFISCITKNNALHQWKLKVIKLKNNEYYSYKNGDCHLRPREVKCLYIKRLTANETRISVDFCLVEKVGDLRKDVQNWERARVSSGRDNTVSSARSCVRALSEQR